MESTEDTNTQKETEESTLSKTSTKFAAEARKSSYYIFQNSKFSKTGKKEFTIDSVTVEKTRINRIFGELKTYDDDIYIITIKGNTELSPNLTWKVYKNYKETKQLFEDMLKELTKEGFEDEYTTIHCKMVKKFSEKEFDDNLNNIGKYIMIIYNSENGKKLEALNEFLQISSTSFSYINGLKPFEGYASKKDEPRAINSVFKLVTRPVDFFKGWNKRWIVLKEDMISYLKDRTALSGKNVYWFDEHMEISTTHDKILELKNLTKTLLLKFESKFERDLWKREIELRVNKIRDGIMNNKYSSFSSQKSNCGAKWFVDGESYFGYLLNQLKGAKESVYITDWFLSPELALKRPINYEEFVNDPEYQKKLTFGNVSRLMDVLYLLAKKGVKIFILIYCEVSLALAINSANAKATLKKLHPNIVVTRHPKNTTTLLWSHHEKLVIIDQKMAFVGGLDLCWGRYDSHKHPIVEEENLTHLYYYPGSDYVNERQVDFHDVDKFWQEQLDRNSMPRMAWHDVHTMVEGPVVGDIVRHFIERWDDARFNRVNQGLVTAGTSSFSFDAGGESKKDKKKREKEQKKKEKEKKKEEKAKGKKKVFLTKKLAMVEDRNFPNQQKYTNVNNEENNEIKEEDEENNEENKIENNEENKAIDNNTEEKKADTNEPQKEVNNQDNNNTFNLSYTFNTGGQLLSLENMLCFQEEGTNNNPNPNNDNASNKEPAFRSQSTVGGDSLPPLSSQASDNVYLEKHEEIRNYFNELEKTKTKTNQLQRQMTNKFTKYKSLKIKQKMFFDDDDDEPKDQSVKLDFNIQALRSVSEWSIGKTDTECSILKAYYKLIDNAKHYIYIENQFFISKPYSEKERKESGLNLNKLVENEIALHIRQRIERAYENNEKFKVFICVPLLPGFSGTPGESSTMNGVLKHTFLSIAHNKGMSLLELLRQKLGFDLNKYIYFFSLRNHGVIKGVPVTELIYIHSKLLIVDDETVLMGSANINDRSMLGERDSEFAVIVEKENKVESLMDNQKYMASEYAKSLRKHLMSEHMGFDINDKILDDPLNDELWSTMRSRAELNSSIYRDIFDCFPDNKFKTFGALKTRKIIRTEEDKEELKKLYAEKIGGIQGHIVEYPVEFLYLENLDIDFFSKENLIPEKNFI